MKRFKYNEIQNGKRVVGEMEAKDKDEVIRTIRSRGGTVISIELTKGESFLNKEIKLDFLQKKVKLGDLAIFSKQMSTLLNTGVTLVRALDTVSEQTGNKRLKKITREMSLEIQKGNTLYDVMKEYPEVFPKLMISMIGAAEMTGQIDKTFEKLNIHYSKENKTKKAVANAMIYPIFLLVVAVIVVGVMLVWVMPSILSSFKPEEVPALTNFVMGVSYNLIAYWYVYLIAIVSFVFIFKRVLRTEKGKYRYDLITAKIPVIGKTLNVITTSRFTRTLATLTSTGASLIPALAMSAELTNNKVLITKINYVIEEIKKGRTLGILLREAEFFPTIMVSMVGIGEESGDLDGMLLKTANYYEDELEASIKTMLNILEPSIIVIMAILIVILMLAFMLPMFGMYENLG